MLKKLLRSVGSNIVASRLSVSSFQALLLPQRRSLPVRRHVAAVIAARAQLIAALFFGSAYAPGDPVLTMDFRRDDELASDAAAIR